MLYRWPGSGVLLTGSPAAAEAVSAGAWNYGIIALHLTGNETMNDVKAINWRESVWYWAEPTARNYRQALDVMEMIPHCRVVRQPRDVMSLESGIMIAGDLWFFLTEKAMSYSRIQVERLVMDYEKMELQQEEAS